MEHEELVRSGERAVINGRVNGQPGRDLWSVFQQNNCVMGRTVTYSTELKGLSTVANIFFLLFLLCCCLKLVVKRVFLKIP